MEYPIPEDLQEDFTTASAALKTATGRRYTELKRVVELVQRIARHEATGCGPERMEAVLRGLHRGACAEEGPDMTAGWVLEELDKLARGR